MGAGENQSYPPRPRWSQTGGSDPASSDVREKIPDKHRNAQGNPWLICAFAILQFANEMSQLSHRKIHPERRKIEAIGSKKMGVGGSPSRRSTTRRITRGAVPMARGHHG